MTSKNQTQAWIRRKGREKFAETAPEIFVARLLESLAYDGFSMSITPQSPIDVGELILRPDFLCRSPYFIDELPKVIEVDGAYHFTDYQEKKRKWRDKLLVKAGFNVVHIDARLCIPKYREYAKTKLKTALLSTDGVVVIPA